MAITEPFIPCFWCSGILLTNFLCHKTEPISHKTIGGARSLSLLRSFLSPFTIPLFTIQFYCSPVIAVEKIKRLWVRFRPCPRKEVGDWTSPYTLSLSLSLSLAHTHTHSQCIMLALCGLSWAFLSYSNSLSASALSLSLSFPLSPSISLSSLSLYLSSFLPLFSFSHTYVPNTHINTLSQSRDGPS